MLSLVGGLYGPGAIVTDVSSSVPTTSICVPATNASKKPVFL